MRFGLFGSAAARPSGTGGLPSYDGYIDYVVEAERLGFESAFLVEHHFSGTGQVSASLNLLSHVAARTSRIRLGTAVIVIPWHNPVLLAEEVATLDVLSKGRFDFGVGRGYRQTEFDGFMIGIEEADARFEEGMEIIRKAWAAEGRFSHESKRWRFQDIIVEPAPYQKPHPPLWMAAGRPASLEKAAHGGYRLLLDQFATFDEIGERLAIYRAAVKAAGRTLGRGGVAVSRAFHISSTRAEREAGLAQRDRILTGLKRAAGEAKSEVGATMLSYSDTRGASEEGALIGDRAEVIDRIRKLEAQGVDYILLTSVDGSIASLRRFADEIMPAFASRAGAVASR